VGCGGKFQCDYARQTPVSHVRHFLEGPFARIVAGCGSGLYSRAVRKSCWQRWTLIFLLMARLVIGELGHAMPVAAMLTLEQGTSEMAACPEHEGSGEQLLMTHHGDASDDATAHDGGEHDCCKSGDCECPCLQLPCAGLDAAVMNSLAITLLQIAHGADAVPSARPSGLFRPPARFS